MRLLRCGPSGAEVPAVLHGDGTIRDLSRLINDIGCENLGSESLEDLKNIDFDALPVLPADSRIGPCVANISKIVCVGLNYADHARETGADLPDEPVIFLKSSTSVTGPNDNIIMPPHAEKLDWEVELGVVIGTRASHVSRDSAECHIAGYCIVHDVSERAHQLERGGQWTKGKSADSFAPLGPWLVTKDEVRDVGKLGLWLNVNGTRMQSGTTGDMYFDPVFLVSYISRFMTLLPGDVISTGTPAGVGLGRVPPLYLKAGDDVCLGIDGLGRQTQKVVSHQSEGG